MKFAEAVPSSFPIEAGVYVIGGEWQILYAGATNSLQRRLYREHLMGHQVGNLPAKLVSDQTCADLGDAKAWIRKKCYAQFLVIEDESERFHKEEAILSLWKPKYREIRPN